MKILHITYHAGCEKNINYVAKQLGHEIIVQHADWNYNIGHKRATEIWERYKDFYHQFDLIITSDTAPLSRILLQNKYQDKLIIWVCNRFDYADMASNDCGFPDPEYYRLFREAIGQSNIKVFSYTSFEHEYAAQFRNITWGTKTIKPCAFIEKTAETAFSQEIQKSETFFIPQYHNDTILINLKKKCDTLEIPAYGGRYNGPSDLKGFRGIIHIPYAWSNLALFENWSIGNVYFIPSKKFLLELSQSGNFFWSPPFVPNLLECSEWYLPEHQNLFIYFDSWEHLQNLVQDEAVLRHKKQEVLSFSTHQTQATLSAWQNAIEKW